MIISHLWYFVIVHKLFPEVATGSELEDVGLHILGKALISLLVNSYWCQGGSSPICQYYCDTYGKGPEAVTVCPVGILCCPVNVVCSAYLVNPHHFGCRVTIYYLFTTICPSWRMEGTEQSVYLRRSSENYLFSQSFWAWDWAIIKGIWF